MLLAMIAFEASAALRQQNMRCALSWSVPKAATFWNGMASNPTHKVNCTSGLVERSSKRNLPAAPASATNAAKPPSMPAMSRIKASNPPPMKTKNWITSVQMTVVIPPISVHPMAKTPMMTMHHSKARPVTVHKMSAVTSNRTLCPRIDPTKKSDVVKTRAPAPRRTCM